MKNRIFLVVGLLILTVPAMVFDASGQKKTKEGGNQTPRPSRRQQPGAGKGVSGDWLQWGGPRRDFITSITGLASTWPAGGPQKVWSRPLGDGYSGIAVEGSTLYTTYRRGTQDVVTAINAQTGKTIWECAYENPFKNAWAEGVGPGPYAMPQVIGDRLVTASSTGKVHSIDKKTGRSVWSHDLYSEFGGTHLEFGYSCHALPYRDYLIFLVGGRGNGVLALKQADGATVWKGLDFTNAHSSPLLIEVDGQPQVVALLASEVIGFSPDNGQLLWRHRHDTQYGLAISTPVWAPGNLLFISSAYNGGARTLQLNQSGGKTTVKELWHNNRLQSHFGSIIRDGDHVYFSSGHNGPAFMTCVNLRSGAIAWQERGLEKAQLLAADGKLILLDQDGTLALAQATPRAFRVLAKTSLLQRFAWTPPTLAGKRLFVRDRHNLMALNLE
ncbi:MAG TPA: PQQ-binding-like beta-propeller repeat protein [Blastocatellia bacterium]|nr:PQQ-binding-like beta-propeller repeat protein [Blastocatellia bacterium]